MKSRAARRLRQKHSTAARNDDGDSRRRPSSRPARGLQNFARLLLAPFRADERAQRFFCSINGLFLSPNVDSTTTTTTTSDDDDSDDDDMRRVARATHVDMRWPRQTSGPGGGSGNGGGGGAFRAAASTVSMREDERAHARGCMQEQKVALGAKRETRLRALARRSLARRSPSSTGDHFRCCLANKCERARGFGYPLASRWWSACVRARHALARSLSRLALRLLLILHSPFFVIVEQHCRGGKQREMEPLSNRLVS